MPRWLVRAVTTLVILVVSFVVLDFAGLLVPVAADRTASMAPAIPACDGRALVEGFTYRFRDPHRGEIVAIHAAGELGGEIVPDSDARDLVLTGRVAGLPGDQVLARNGSVFVNGVKFDDIQTADFPRVDLASERYFVVSDNRNASQDSRDFGPVLRDAIFGRVFLVFWPLGDVGPTEGRHAGAPLGKVSCGR